MTPPKPNPDDLIKSRKQFADFASELLDSEIDAATKIIVSIQRKYATRMATPRNLEMLRDETLTRLAEINIVATVDPAPVFYGEPPIVEIVGKINTDAIHKDGMDHEQKGYEVRKGLARGEDFLGEKERVNARMPKKSD